jgi:type VI secretion system secreted protein Hcp
MKIDLFLKLDGIDGESTDARHRNEIELLSYSWGETQLVINGIGGGSASKVQMQDLHCALHSCSATPKLMLAVATGKHLKHAILSLRRAGKTPLDFLQWTLGDVRVSSYHTAAEQGSELPPTDQVSLHFNTLTLAYHPQQADGSLGAAITAGWDVTKNQAI